MSALITAFLAFMGGVYFTNYQNKKILKRKEKDMIMS